VRRSSACGSWTGTTDEFTHFIIADLFGRFLEQERRKLHRLDVYAFMLEDLRRDRLHPCESSRRERNQPPFGPARVGRPPATGGHAEPGFDVRPDQQRPEVAPVEETGPRRSAPRAAAILSMSSCVFIGYSTAKSRMAKYSSPITRPTSPWRARRRIVLQKLPSSAVSQPSRVGAWGSPCRRRSTFVRGRAEASQCGS
jgi:hypothetical protein